MNKPNVFVDGVLSLVRITGWSTTIVGIFPRWHLEQRGINECMSNILTCERATTFVKGGFVKANVVAKAQLKQGRIQAHFDGDHG